MPLIFFPQIPQMPLSRAKTLDRSTGSDSTPRRRALRVRLAARTLSGLFFFQVFLAAVDLAGLSRAHASLECFLQYRPLKMRTVQPVHAHLYLGTRQPPRHEK